MMIGLGLSLSLSLGGRSGGGGAPAPISAIAANGWTADMVTPADLSLSPITVQRQGYNALAQPIAIAETLYTTKRVRQAYPNHASLTASDVALSDYLLSTDTVAGVTNNSAEVMPVPIANWSMQSRMIVGNMLRLSVTGNHWSARNGAPFACVEFSVSDGTTTVTAKVSSMSVSTVGAGDVFAVLAYETDIDISTLANPADITANAKVYPWIGGLASVHDSSLNSGTSEFSPRLFRRDTAKFAAPNVVYVATTGNDTTGYVGTDAGLAEASPCRTPNGAINRARTVLGSASGSLNGLRVWLTEGSWVLGNNPTTNTVDMLVTIEPAPGAAKANTIWQFGAANYTPALTYVVYKGLSIVRQGAFYITNSTGFTLVEDCTVNPNGFTGAIATGTGRVFFWNGVTFTGASGSMLAPSTAQSSGMVRGVTQTVSGSFHAKLILGCRLAAAGLGASTYPQSNSIVQFNSFPTPPSGNATLELTATLTGYSVSQNLFEVTHTTTSTPSLRPSSDSNTNSLTHVLFDNNSVASGHSQVGRFNAFYDETALTYRQHKFCRVSRAFAGAIFHKGDWFLGANGNGSPNPTDAPLHTGNWGQLYGVGWIANVTLYGQPATNTVGSIEGQAYPGPLSSIGTSNTAPTVPYTAVTNWQATTANTGTGAAIAGAGGGDYSLPPGSPLLGRVTSAQEVFPFDLDGNARDRGSIGAYR